MSGNKKEKLDFCCFGDRGLLLFFVFSINLVTVYHVFNFQPFTGIDTDCFFTHQHTIAVSIIQMTTTMNTSRSSQTGNGNIPIFQDSPDKKITTTATARGTRNTSQFSYLSTDTSSNDDDEIDDIELELFNDENLFPSKNNIYKLKSPKKLHTRSSMRIKNDDNNNNNNTRISMFKSRYSSSNMNSKISIVDITNTSNLSITNSNLSRRTSNLSSKRNYSFTTENGSIISFEKKRNQIIQRLNKRNSKNLSNPYFYQYKNKNNLQPRQSPPELPDEYNQLDSIDSFSNFLINNSTEESLNFVDNKINNFKIFSKEGKNISNTVNHTEENNNNSNNNNNNSRNDETYNTTEAYDGNDTGNSSHDTNNNTGNTGNTGNSSHDTNNNNTTNSTNNSKNTSSESDETTSSEEANLSRRIRISQQTFSGVFSEMSFVSSTAPLVMTTINKSPHIPQIIGNNTLNQVIEENSIDDHISTNQINKNDNSNINYNTTKSSILTVSTDDLQHDQFLNKSKENLNKNDDHSNIYASPFNNSKLLLPEDYKNFPIGPTLTVKNMNNKSNSNSSNDSNESKLKDFNLSNNSSVSIFLNPKQLQRLDSQSETILEHASQVHKLVENNDKKKGKLNRKPPPPNLPNKILKSPNISANSSGSYHDAISNYQQRQQPMINNENQFIQLQSDDSDITNDSNISNGSRDQLLTASSSSKPNNKKVGISYQKDLEKSELIKSDYLNFQNTYYDYEYNIKCSNLISIMIITFSLLAPPFWLIISLGYLDKHFGVIDKKFKIISLIMFSIFCIGSIIGIGVGFGYGMTHRG